MTEEWRTVVGFPNYEVSNLGEVRRAIDSKISTSAVPGRILRQLLTTQGRPFVALVRDGRAFSRAVYHLVMEAFVGPRPDGMEVNHIDFNVLNSSLSNLEYVTHTENMRHAARGGRLGHARLVGEKNPVAKLTERDVREIRRLSATGMIQREIAARFGVSRSAVCHVLLRKCWANVA